MPDVAARAERFAGLRDVRAGLVRKVLRYGTGAIVAVICSQTTFLVLYGPLGASTTASVAAVLDGTSVSDGAQTLFVSGTYFLVYALMFVFRFLLFDRLFAAQGTQETHETHPDG